MLRQGRRQHQASVGHQTLVVEGHVETVETVELIGIVPCVGDVVGVVTTIFPSRGTFSGCRDPDATINIVVG